MLHPEPPAREGAADGVGLLAGTSPQTARDARWASMGRLDKREAGVDSLPNISHLARREAQVPLVRVRGQPFEDLVGRIDRWGPSCLRGLPLPHGR